jgi:hypothetical protein
VKFSLSKIVEEKMFIQRDYNRTEHDDFLLNVSSRLNEFTEAVPQYVTATEGEELIVVGWKIQRRYE